MLGISSINQLSFHKCIYAPPITLVSYQFATWRASLFSIFSACSGNIPACLVGTYHWADQVVKLFHRSLTFIVEVLAYETHIVTFVCRVTLSSVLLTRQSLPTSVIVMSLRPTVRNTLFNTIHDHIAPFVPISHFG